MPAPTPTPPATPEPAAASLPRRDFLRNMGIAGGAVALSGFLAACGSSSKTSSDTASVGSTGTSSGAASNVGSGKTIGIALNVANAYAAYVAQGVLKALSGTKYQTHIVINNADASTELSNIENLISAGISGLVILPTNVQTSAKGAQLCLEKGIPYGNALWPGPSPADKYFTSVAYVNDTQGGRMIGQYLKTHAKPGPLIVVQGILGQGFSEPIDAGLDAELNGSGFSVAVRQPGFFDRTKATNIVETGLQAHPDVTGIVTYSASMSDGVAQYLKSRNRTDLTHVASDCDQELVTWLKTPYCNATRYYSAAQSGLVVARAVRAKLDGGTPTFKNTLTETMATGANIDQVTQSDPFNYPQYASQTANF